MYFLITGIILTIIFLFFYNKIDVIYDKEISIINIEIEVLKYLLENTGFIINNYTDSLIDFKLPAGDSKSGIEDDLLMIHESNFPIYYFDSQVNNMKIIKEKPISDKSKNITEKKLEYILNFSSDITLNISKTDYKIIFNKNKRIILLYPDGKKPYKFTESLNKLVLHQQKTKTQ